MCRNLGKLAHLYVEDRKFSTGFQSLISHLQINIGNEIKQYHLLSFTKIYMVK